MIELQSRDWEGRAVTVRQEEGERWYQVGKGELPGCTTVIGAIWGPPFPPEAAANAEYARKRGQQVHRACMFSAQNRLDRDSLDPDVAPRVFHYEDWCDKRRWTPAYIEQAFWDLEYGYACTPDQVGWFDDPEEPIVSELVVLEIKPPTAPYVGLQTIAAAMAVRRCLGLNYTPERVALFLSEDGAKDVLQRKRSQDRAGFLAALTCFNYGRERKLWR
jgi:hypothetical protein